MKSKNFQNLKNHIIPLSVALNFDEAKIEWTLDHIVITNNFGKCPCTKDIKEHCYIRNMKNGKKTHVGNVCVRRFMDINANKLFAGMKRIQKNGDAAIYMAKMNTHF